MSLICVPLIVGDLVILTAPPEGLLPERFSWSRGLLCSCLDMGKQVVMFNGITKGLSIALGR